MRTITDRIKTKRHIVAMGGGGFSEEPDNPLLDDFILGLTGKKLPSVCFLPTASGDAQGYVDNFYNAFPPKRARALALTLFRHPGIEDLRSFILGQDVIYVGGGSTANMLAVWRVHGLDRLLREAWESGVVLAGLSAGMICWFQESLTDSFGGIPSPLCDGLALLAGSACPHYDSDTHRRPAFHACIARGELSDGVAADDGAAIHYIGTTLVEAISSRPEARAFTVIRKSNRAVERPLETRYLG